MSQIGLIGYGKMGAAMALPLAESGHDVIGTDIDDQRRALAKAQGHLAEPRTVSSREIVILALRGPADVRAVTEGDFTSGQLVIDTTSIDPATAVDVAQRLRRRGAAYVEAPVLGGPPQVGRWVFLFGGETEAVTAASTALQPLGEGDHFGEIGRASEAKLLNNILTGVHAAAIGEVLRVAFKRGVDVAAFQHSIMRSESAGRNPILEIRVPKILNGTLQDTFSIDNETKDLDLALRHFKDDDTLALSRATYAIFQRAQEVGWGPRDIGRLFEA